jgi:hypothetical protein
MQMSAAYRATKSGHLHLRHFLCGPGPHCKASVRTCNTIAKAQPSPDKPVQINDSSSSAADKKADEAWKDPLSAGQILGSYMLLGLWIIVLSGAAFVGFQKVCIYLSTFMSEKQRQNSMYEFTSLKTLKVALSEVKITSICT